GFDPELGHLEEQLVRVMPGMATLVMRRRRQGARRPASLPVGLPLQSSAVAARAVLLVDLLALRHQFSVRVIGLSGRAGAPDGHERTGYGDEDHAEGDGGSSCFSHPYILMLHAWCATRAGRSVRRRCGAASYAAIATLLLDGWTQSAPIRAEHTAVP